MADWKDQFDYYYDKVNNANLESAKKQMEFQKEMSDTSHQREVKDLIAAGLNPVLSANNGASTPMGAYASVDSSPISAKFARENLNKELENQRLITSMQNDTSKQIALAQLAGQMELGKYTVDTQTKTQRFDTIVQEYGVMAGLAYGLAEDLYNNDPALQSKVSWLLDQSATVGGMLGIANSDMNADQMHDAFVALGILPEDSPKPSQKKSNIKESVKLYKDTAIGKVPSSYYKDNRLDPGRSSGRGRSKPKHYNTDGNFKNPFWNNLRNKLVYKYNK